MIHKLRPYQTNLFNDTSQFIICNKNRQAGLTWLWSLKALYNSVKNGQNSLIVSSTQAQSNIISSNIDAMLEDILKIYPHVKTKKNSIEEKTFINKNTGIISSIRCLPSRGSSIRGFTAPLIIFDEFSIMANSDEIYTALLPSITTFKDKFQIVISSTPFGEGNLFHTIFTDTIKYPKFKRYQLTIEDCIADGLECDLDLIKSSLTEEAFLQEYFCVFANSSECYFDYDLIRKCITEFDPDSKFKEEGEIHMGIDIGRYNDASSISVLKKIKERFYLLDTIRMKNKDFDEQEFTILNAIEKYNPLKVVGDRGGLGMQLMENLNKKDSRVQGIQLSNESKVEMFTLTKKNMEQGNLIFNEDENLMRQLNSVKKKISSNNNVIFTQTRNKLGHGDDVSSLTLACYSAKNNNSFFGIGFL